MKVFGIEIDTLSHKEVLDHVQTFLDEPKYHRIATVNPEFLLLAEQDAAFRDALLAADLRIADGFGIVLAGLLRGRRIERFAGADLMDAILRIANDRKLSVFLAVRADGLSTYEEVRAAILERFPHIQISGSDIDVHQNLESGISNLEPRFKNQKSKIILCNFGAPYQETFLASLHDTEVSLGMGVGGSFDYLTGKQRRAPRWMQVIGLEWLWRLILQPKRWKRIYNAVILFPIKAFFSK